MKESPPCVTGVACDAGTRRATQQQSKTVSHERTTRKNNCNLVVLAVFFRRVRCGGRRILGHAAAMRQIAAPSTSTARIRENSCFAFVTVAVGSQRCSRTLAGYESYALLWTTTCRRSERSTKNEVEKRNILHSNMEAGLHRGQLKISPVVSSPSSALNLGLTYSKQTKGR